MAWFNLSIPPQTVAIGAIAAIDLLPTAQIPVGFEGGLTVIRMIAQVNETGLLTGNNFFGAHAVYLLTRAALTALGIASPIDDLVDWYYHKGYTSNALGPQLTPETDQVDIRTARRIRGNDRTLAFVMEVNGASQQSVSVSANFRLLLARS